MKIEKKKQTLSPERQRKLLEAKRKKGITGGRPTLMTESTIAKLKEGFAQGFSVRNACIWADIGQDTYYDYCKKFPEFGDQCKTLQQKPLIKSILVINKALNEGDVSTAKWYAERKAKDEFSTKQETEFVNPPTFQLIVSGE